MSDEGDVVSIPDELFVSMIEAKLALGPRVLEILGCHHAAETALDAALSQLFPRAEQLPANLGFDHKLAVLAAALPGSAADPYLAQFRKLNVLRNAAAHRSPSERSKRSTLYRTICEEVSALTGADCTGTLALELALDQLVLHLQAATMAAQSLRET